MTDDQCYWYERGLHAGKSQASEAQGYKKAYFALLEMLAKNEAMLPRQTILTMPQRTWVGLTDEEFQMIYDMGRTPAGMMEMVEAKLKEKNTK